MIEFQGLEEEEEMNKVTHQYKETIDHFMASTLNSTCTVVEKVELLQ